ncbi:glycoside hydrolase family 43 protein [Fomes fomentarius]|nr:glycoside hydrolase family 43 protein [Fomes fomentarius]
MLYSSNFCVLGSAFGPVLDRERRDKLPTPGDADKVELRDPAIWYNPDSKTYFVFSTGKNIPIFTSNSLTGPWNQAGSVLSNCSMIQHVGRCTPWAPDINSVDGRYVLYYALSSSGSPNSAIGVATSPSMGSGSWTDLGEIFRTSNQSGEPPSNAIDANLVQDENGLKLTYGSYHQGIFQLPLSNISTLAANPPGTHLAGANNQPTEGGFTYQPKNSQFFYQFFSNGHTPTINDPDPHPPPGQEYKVLVGRSESASGPFVDKDGKQLTEARDPPTGSLVLGSHDNVYAPGGQSIFLDPVSGRDVIVYHYVPSTGIGGPSYLGINFLNFSSGWPVLVE